MGFKLAMTVRTFFVLPPPSPPLYQILGRALNILSTQRLKIIKEDINFILYFKEYGNTFLNIYFEYNAARVYTVYSVLVACHAYTCILCVLCW